MSELMYWELRSGVKGVMAGWEVIWMVGVAVMRLLGI